MMHTTQWQPDTCGCIIEYDWDDAVPAEDRTHELRTIRKCEFHTMHGNSLAYKAVVDENQRKNVAHGRVIETLPELTEDHPNGDGTSHKRLKPGVEVKWSFDEKRKLKINIVGATDEHKKRVSDALSKDFPAHKLEVI